MATSAKDLANAKRAKQCGRLLGVGVALYNICQI